MEKLIDKIDIQGKIDLLELMAEIMTKGTEYAKYLEKELNWGTFWSIIIGWIIALLKTIWINYKFWILAIAILVTLFCTLRCLYEKHEQRINRKKEQPKKRKRQHSADLPAGETKSEKC